MQSPEALAEMDRILRLDPAWRFYRTFATANQRKIIESPALYLHIRKPNQVGGTATMLVDAALYLKGIHPVRPRPREPMQLLFIVPKKAQMGSIFGRRLFKECGFVTDIPPFKHIVDKEPELKALGSLPLLMTEAQGAHLEKTGSSMGRVVSKATVPGPYGDDELYFYISGDEKAWESIMGNNYHGIYRDESVAKGINLMPELRTRVGIHHDRHTSDRPGCGYIRWGCLSAMYSEELKIFTGLCEAKVEGHDQVRLDQTDNPAISKKTRDAQALGMSKAEADKRLWGTTTAFDENLILRVDRQVVVRSTPYQVQPDDNLWLCWDPGFRDPCAIVLAAVPKNSRDIIILAYRSWAWGTTAEQVACMADLLRGRLAVTIVCDPAVKRSSSVTGISNFVVFCEAVQTAGIRLNSAPCLGRNRYEDGLPLLQTYLSHQDGRALWFDRDGDGTEEALCQMEIYRYKEGATKVALETNIYQKNNQAVDAIRYLCTRMPQWLDLGPNTSLEEYEQAAAALEISDPALAAHKRMLAQGAADYDSFMEENAVPGDNGSLTISHESW